MSELGLVHTVFGLLALVFGLLVLTRRKGTRWHRTVGHLYLSSMIALNVTALSIYRLFGHFGPFHGLALLSLATIIAGVLPVLLRRPLRGWMMLHATFMSWSYVGLLAATAAEVAVRVPGANFALAAIGASTAVTVLGAIVIHRRDSIVIRRAMGMAERS